MTTIATRAWTFSARSGCINPSIIREILKATERPGIISLAGGLPAPETFPVEAMRAAAAKVLAEDPIAALQYTTSEGYGPLRQWIARYLAGRGLHADAEQVLIINGSQQGLDLIGKVLIDPGSTMLVERPTYLGAIQCCALYEPEIKALESDREGLSPQALDRHFADARLLYVQPNFQNPTGRSMSERRRQEIAQIARRRSLPVVEDDPYGELWFDGPCPAPLSAHLPEGSVYLGSFSKVLAPGLRLGYLVAPKALHVKLVQAKQAADLHASNLAQRMVSEVLHAPDFMSHLEQVRAVYRRRCAAMNDLLTHHLGGLCKWERPSGGMFFWLAPHEPVDTTDLLQAALEVGVAFVPGSAFAPDGADTGAVRLSFATCSDAEMEKGVDLLARVLREHSRASRHTVFMPARCVEFSMQGGS